MAKAMIVISTSIQNIYTYSYIYSAKSGINSNEKKNNPFSFFLTKLHSISTRVTQYESSFHMRVLFDIKLNDLDFNKRDYV